MLLVEELVFVEGHARWVKGSQIDDVLEEVFCDEDEEAVILRELEIGCEDEAIIKDLVDDSDLKRDVAATVIVDLFRFRHGEHLLQDDHVSPSENSAVVVAAVEGLGFEGRSLSERKVHHVAHFEARGQLQDLVVCDANELHDTLWEETAHNARVVCFLSATLAHDLSFTQTLFLFDVPVDDLAGQHAELPAETHGPLASLCLVLWVSGARARHETKGNEK